MSAIGVPAGTTPRNLAKLKPQLAREPFEGTELGTEGMASVRPGVEYAPLLACAEYINGRGERSCPVIKLPISVGHGSRRVSFVDWSPSTVEILGIEVYQRIWRQGYKTAG